MENVMSDMNVKRPLPLSLPIVSIAYPDGLLKSADLSSPIPVLVEMWEAAEPGYYFQLTLNGELVGDIRAFTETDKNGELFTVFLSEDLLAEHGNYRLGYMASSPYSDSHTPSPEVTLKVDRSAPGAALLAPMIVTDHAVGERFTGLVPGYAGMESGDIIQTTCNGTAGPIHTVQPDELTIRPIEIVFEREALQSFAAQNVVIDYSVTDRAGNQSIKSLPVTLSLTL